MTDSWNRGTIDDIVAPFTAARGDDSDAEWARTAAARFILDETREDLARNSLSALLPQIVETQEPPGSLYGDPLEWVQDQYRTWREQGITARAPRTPTSARDLVVDSLTRACVFSVVFGLISLVSGLQTEVFRLPMVLAPLLLAAASTALSAVFERQLRTHAFPGAVAAGLGALLLAVLAITGFFFATRDVVLFEANTLVWFAIATGFGGIGWVTAGLWPERHTTPASPSVTREAGTEVHDDVEWLAELTAALRGRGDMPEPRIQHIVTEAHQHGIDARNPLSLEFGDPASYAARFEPDPGVKHRRRAWFWSALSIAPAGLLASYVAEDGWAWRSPYISTSLWLILIVSLAAYHWRTSATSAR